MRASGNTSLRKSASPQPICAKITSGTKPLRRRCAAPAATRRPRCTTLPGGRVIPEQPYARHRLLAPQVLVLPDRDDLVTVARVVRSDVPVLAGEVLVDEQN